MENGANNNSNMRVLVVDDEKDIRDGCQRILSRMNFEVLTASHGEEALSVLDEHDAAIVLLDLKMPGIDGMEVLRRIREKELDVLVIVITGFATVEAAIEAMKKGAYDFIPKPFEPAQLRIVVERAREKLRLTWEAEKLAEERKRTMADLGAEKSRTRTIIESLPNGVVVTNTLGQVALLNPAFCLYLGLDLECPSGDKIEAYIPDEGLCQLIMDISQGKYAPTDEIPPYEFALPDGKFLLARSRPVMGEEGECLGAVVNLTDITAMKVIDRLKSEFVAKVSHELRSPLSTIHEQLAMALRDIAKEESRIDQHLLTRAKEKTQGLISLIGDMLDLSRIETGNVCHELRPMKLEDLMKSIVEFMGDKAGSRKQTLTLDIVDPNLPSITADPMAMESIFGNLIANAINYTPDGGTIKVTMGKADGKIRVKVSDSGFGIPKDKLDKIFERFYRVKDENTRFITGTGLGLSIVKGLLDALEGEILVESTVGKGTTFTVLIPVKE